LTSNRDEKIRWLLEVDDARRTGDVDRLMQLLRHGALLGRHDALRAAIEALGDLGAAQSADLLADYVADADERTRVVAIVALRTLRSSSASSHLIAALSDTVDRVVWCAADALAEIRTQDAVPALAAVLQSHRNWWPRRSAARALALIGGADSLTALSRARQSERNPLRRRALSAYVRQAEASVVNS